MARDYCQAYSGRYVEHAQSLRMPGALFAQHLPCAAAAPLPLRRALRCIAAEATRDPANGPRGGTDVGGYS